MDGLGTWEMDFGLYSSVVVGFLFWVTIAPLHTVFDGLCLSNFSSPPLPPLPLPPPFSRIQY